jgi:hypothetical protein
MKWNSQKRRYEDGSGKPIPPAKVRLWLEDYISANKDDIQVESDSLIERGAKVVMIGSFFEFMRQKVQEMHGTSGVIAYGGEDQMSPERWERVGEKIVKQLGYLDGFERAVRESRHATDDLIGSIASAAPSIPHSAIEKAILTNSPSEVSAVVQSLSPVNADSVAGVIAGQGSRLDTLIWGQVGSRGRLYADATWATHELSIKAREMDAGVLRGRRVTEGDDRVCAGCEAAASDEYMPFDEIPDIGDQECQASDRCTIEFDYQ